MSEDESRLLEHDEDGDEVEGHATRSAANIEAGEETDGDDDVEGHVQRTSSPRNV